MVIIEICALVIVLILTGAWINNPEGNFEPYIGLFGLVFVAFDIARRFKECNKHVNSHDLKLYEEYKSLFINNGVAEFYRQHDFLGSFKEEYWRPMSTYVDNWHRVEYEFVDKELQKAHKKVYEQAERIGIKIAQYTVPIGTGGYMRSVKPDNLPLGPTPEYIKKEAQQINELVPAFIEAHNRFVKLANKKLYKNA